MPSDTAIQPLLIGDNKQALSLSEGLRERGIWVAAIRRPQCHKVQHDYELHYRRHTAKQM